MNMQKNKGQEWSNILLNEDSFNIPRDIPETFSSPPPSDMGLYYFQGLEGVSTKLNLRAASITNITSSHTGSTSAFNTSEQCMCLPQTRSHSNSLSSSSQFLKNHNLVIPSCQPYSNIESQDQDSLDLQSTDYMESLVKVPLQNNQNLRSELFELLQNSDELDSSLKWRPTYISFEGNQCNKVSCNPCSSQLPKPISITHSNSVLSRVAASSKTRIRWTQDLHKRFVECVNRLGGADKATPKEIVKLMDASGLTLLQVKSHLQKYRTTRCIPESTLGKSDRIHMNRLMPFDLKTGKEIAEALRVQLHVQRSLHEQLEVQREMQSMIEEQGKQLTKMLDQQLITNKTLIKSLDLDLTSPHNQSHKIKDVAVSNTEEFQDNLYHSDIVCQMCLFNGQSVPSNSADSGEGPL